MLKEELDRLVLRAAGKTKTLQIALNLPQQGFEYSFSSTHPDQRFHSASVGKLCTATLVFLAIEQGKLALDSRVSGILEPALLEGLFLSGGTDYRDEVTVRQLLSHRSGANDYFEGKTLEGSAFTAEVLRNPDTFWKPVDLLDFTRKRQKAVAPPGRKFFYSDTGYILLGLLVETVFGMPFHRALEAYIFRPAGMDSTQLCFYSDGFDRHALAPLFLNGTDVRLFTSLSCDFSGGGLSVTARDLLKFLNHLQAGRLVGRESLALMAGFDQRFRQGIRYGNGMMQLRFHEFFFLLKNLPRLQGHLGITGVHAWYDPETGAAYVMNVGNTKDMNRSFQLLIRILQLVQRSR